MLRRHEVRGSSRAGIANCKEQKWESRAWGYLQGWDSWWVLEFCLDERRSELGVSGWAEKWLPYWVLGLQFVTALEYCLIVLVLESERKGWRGGRGTSLMSLAPQWLRVQCGWLFPCLSQPHPRVHWVSKWLHLSIAKWKFFLKDTETFSYFGVMTFFLIAFYYGMFKYIHEWGEQDSEPQVSITQFSNI